MSTYADRLASFTTWPHASPTPEQMARAGFKHVPTNKYPDNVICSCGDGNDYLYDWKPEDDPKLELHTFHHRCSKLWLVLATADRKKPSAKDIGFFDPSLEYDFPDLCLFRNVEIFCNRIRRLRFFETDILDALPSCLRGKALGWFNQSDYRDLATCLGAMRARFWQQAPPEAPLKAPQATLEGPPGGPPDAAPQACRTPDYHHCKLCNASFSSMARLIRHTQENTCNKACCRHCEKVFSSKNRLHQHLREDCQKQMHRHRGSSSKSSSRSSSSPSPPSSPRSSPAYSPTFSPAYSPTSSPAYSPTSSPAYSPTSSPPPRYRAISPPPPIYKTYLTVKDLYARYAAPPYLNIDDLFRMFGGPSATTKSSTITITIDDPFTRPFVIKKRMGSTQKWELEIATSCHQNARAHCFPLRCERPTLLDTDKGASYAKFGLAPLPSS